MAVLFIIFSLETGEVLRPILMAADRLMREQLPT
jgi:hypothetical protein